MTVRRDEEASFAFFYLIPQPRPDVVDAPMKSAGLGRLVTFAPQMKSHGAACVAIKFHAAFLRRRRLGFRCGSLTA